MGEVALLDAEVVVEDHANAVVYVVAVVADLPWMVPPLEEAGGRQPVHVGQLEALCQCSQLVVKEQLQGHMFQAKVDVLQGVA